MASDFDTLVTEISKLILEREVSKKSKTNKIRRKRTKEEKKTFKHSVRYILTVLWQDLNTVPVKESSFNLHQPYYSKNKRYIEHLGLSYRTFKSVYNTLIRLNYLTITANHVFDLEKSENNKLRQHKPSGYLADRLLGLSEQGSDLHPAITILPDLNRETIILRNQSKKLQDYEDTSVTNKFRRQIKKINTVLSKHWPDLLLRDNQWPELERRLQESNREYLDFSRRTVDRIFSNYNFSDSGRMYRTWWSEIPNKVKEGSNDLPYRNFITLDGMPTTEIDYAGLGPNIFYALCNKQIGEVDPYDRVFDGQHRSMVKLGMNAMIQASTQLGRCPRDNKLKELLVKADFNSDIDRAWRYLRKKIKDAHPDVRDYFGQGLGAKIQHEDSNLIISVMLYYAERDIPVLPVHDSLLIDWKLSGTREDLRDQMLVAFEKRFKKSVTVKEEDMFKVRKPLVELAPFMGLGTTVTSYISMLEENGNYRRWTSRQRAWLKALPDIKSKLGGELR